MGIWDEYVRRNSCYEWNGNGILKEYVSVQTKRIDSRMNGCRISFFEKSGLYEKLTIWKMSIEIVCSYKETTLGLNGLKCRTLIRSEDWEEDKDQENYVWMQTRFSKEWNKQTTKMWSNEWTLLNEHCWTQEKNKTYLWVFVWVDSLLHSNAMLTWFPWRC